MSQAGLYKTGAPLLLRAKAYGGICIINCITVSKGLQVRNRAWLFKSTFGFLTLSLRFKQSIIKYPIKGSFES